MIWKHKDKDIDELKTQIQNLELDVAQYRKTLKEQKKTIDRVEYQSKTAQRIIQAIDKWLESQGYCYKQKMKTDPRYNDLDHMTTIGTYEPKSEERLEYEQEQQEKKRQEIFDRLQDAASELGFELKVKKRNKDQ